MASHQPAWRPFPSRRKNRGEERRRKLAEAIGDGRVRTPPIAEVHATPPSKIGMKPRPVPYRRSHDWRPVKAPGNRLATVCLACGAQTVFVVKADGSWLKLAGPASTACAGKMTTPSPTPGKVAG